VVISDIVRAAALTVLAAAVITDTASIALLAATSFAITAGKCFADPASQAMLPAVVGRDSHALSAANGRLYATDTVGRSLLGPPIGGFTFSLAPWAPFVVDAASFAGSAALLAALPPAPAPKRDGQRIWPAVREGFAYLFRDRGLLGLAATMTVFNVAYNMAAATLVLFAKLELELSDVGFGLLLAAGAAGAVLAGWTSAPITRRFSVNAVLAIGVLAQAVAWPAFLIVDDPLVAGLVFAILGAASTYVTTAVVSARQMRVPDRLLGRVVSAFRLFGNGASPIGAMLGGIIASAYGLRAPFAAASILLLAFVAIAALALVFRRRA
jgi:MFS family permease